MKSDKEQDEKRDNRMSKEPMNQQHVAIFGSAFNPPHLGHADVIEQVLLHTSKLVLVPSYRHAFGKHMMPFDLRLDMLSAMLSDLNISHLVSVSTIEKDLARKQSEVGSELKPVYTYQVLEALEKELGTRDLAFVVGPDNAAPETWNKFYKANELTQRWQLWAAEERLFIRSSSIRQALANNQGVDGQQCTQGVINLLKEVDFSGE